MQHPGTSLGCGCETPHRRIFFTRTLAFFLVLSSHFVQTTSYRSNQVFSVPQALLFDSPSLEPPQYVYALVPISETPQVRHGVAMHLPRSTTTNSQPARSPLQAPPYFLLPLYLDPAVALGSSHVLQHYSSHHGRPDLQLQQHEVSPMDSVLVPHGQDPSYRSAYRASKLQPAVHTDRVTSRIASLGLQVPRRFPLSVQESHPQRPIFGRTRTRSSHYLTTQSLLSSQGGVLPSRPFVASSRNHPARMEPDEHGLKQRALDEAGHLLVRNKVLLLRLGDVVADAFGETDFLLCPLVLEETPLYRVVPPPSRAVVQCLPPATCHRLETIGQDACWCVPGSCPVVQRLTGLCPLLHLKPKPPCEKTLSSSRSPHGAKAGTQDATLDTSSSAVSEPCNATASETNATSPTSGTEVPTTALPGNISAVNCSDPDPRLSCKMDEDFCSLTVDADWRLMRLDPVEQGPGPVLDSTGSLEGIIAEVTVPVGSTVFPMLQWPVTTFSRPIQVSVWYYFFPETVDGLLRVMFLSDGTGERTLVHTIPSTGMEGSWKNWKGIVRTFPSGGVYLAVEAATLPQGKIHVAVDNVGISFC